VLSTADKNRASGGPSRKITEDAWNWLIGLLTEKDFTVIAEQRLHRSRVEAPTTTSPKAVDTGSASLTFKGEGGTRRRLRPPDAGTGLPLPSGQPKGSVRPALLDAGGHRQPGNRESPFSRRRVRWIVLDQAGRHTTDKLAIPDTNHAAALPPRSRGLNPVENIWRLMRDNWLTDRVVPSLDQIIDLLPRLVQVRRTRWARVHWSASLGS